MERNYSDREIIPYSEKMLSEKLDFTCEQLYPTSGFKLELQGVVPNTLVRKELEAYSGVNLNAKSGATIELAYDIAEDELLLKSLRHPLDQQPLASLIIQKTTSKTDGLEYIAFLDVSGQLFMPAKGRTDKPLMSEDIARIIEGYGVSNIPHPTHDTYRLWRANLLSSCQKGWKVSEAVEIFVDMKEHKTETIKIGIDEWYQESGAVCRTKQVSRILDIIDDNHTTGQRFESSLSQIDSDYGRTVHMRNELTKKEFQPFIPGDTGIELSSETEDINPSYDSINAFRHLLDDTAQYLQETKEV